MSEVQRHGRGRRAGHTTERETMKHGRSAILQRQNTGLGRHRIITPSISIRQTPSEEMKYGKKGVTFGTQSEIESSYCGRNSGSLSAPIVLIESRRTEKRQEPGSRKGGRPRVGTDARKHALNPPRK